MKRVALVLKSLDPFSLPTGDLIVSRCSWNDDQSTQHVVTERIFEFSLAAREVLSRTLMKERIGSLVSFETSSVAR